jgi:hypothetical protein
VDDFQDGSLVKLLCTIPSVEPISVATTKVMVNQEDS